MKIIVLFLTICLMSSCISDREYQLRKKQLENQAKHQQTYEPLSITGPATISIQQGAKLSVKSETQPFKEVYIPDGMKAQESVIKTASGVAAGTFLGYRALKEADAPVKVITKEAGK